MLLVILGLWLFSWTVTTLEAGIGGSSEEIPEKVDTQEHFGPHNSSHPLTGRNSSSCGVFDALIDKDYFVDLPSMPTIVNVTVYLEKLYTIDNTNSDLHLVIYVEAKWFDQRIIDLIPQGKHNAGRRRCLLPTYKVIDKVWYPVLNFHVSADVKTEKLPRENSFLALSLDGTMYFRSKYEMYTPCHVNLRKFPMDEAVCRIDITAIEADPSLVALRWANNTHIVILLNNNTAEHELIDIRDGHILEEEVGIQVDHLTIDLFFYRHVGWYLMFAYFPAYLIILISWLYTTLGTRASRLQLRASLLLALVLMVYHILRQVPKVNYVKAIDVFMIMVLGFLTSSCVEDTVVTWCCNRAQRLESQAVKGEKKKKKKSRSDSLPRSPHFNFSKKVVRRMKARNNPMWVDESGDGCTCHDVHEQYLLNQVPWPEEGVPSSASRQPLIELDRVKPYDSWNPRAGYSPSNGEARRLASSDESSLITSAAPTVFKQARKQSPPLISFSSDNPQRYIKLAESIDHVFIYLYPGLFISANIVYWLYYRGYFG